MSYAAGAAALSPNLQRKPAPTPTIGELAANQARAFDEGQDKQIDERGYGTYTGTKSGETERDGQKLAKTDCTIYVIATLKAAFEQAGLSANWSAVMKDARARSGGALKGTELMKSLQANLGWVGVFFAPDSRSSDAEHAYSASKAKRGQGYYGVSVDKDKVVTDYAPADAGRKTTGPLDKLRRVNFGVLCARGGMHMAMIIKGQVYEVHWDHAANSKDLFDATPLEAWGWGSGAIVMPPDELANWNGTAAP